MPEYTPPKHIQRRQKLDEAIADINAQLIASGRDKVVAYRVANRVVVAKVPPLQYTK